MTKAVAAVVFVMLTAGVDAVGDSWPPATIREVLSGLHRSAPEESR